MSSEEQKPTTNTNDTGSQSGSGAVQRGGAGTDSTPADSDTPKQDSSLSTGKYADQSLQNTSSANVPDFATKRPGGNPPILEGLRNELSHGLGKGTD
ncbi:hypothetical protein DL98DRAFT_593078 [Cadophora sp. DSE1049]|nr:hypothetical protein DL98DRAFT_593078 [Cadophora sp. DSE1049]